MRCRTLSSLFLVSTSLCAQQLPDVEVRRVAGAGGAPELRYAVQLPPQWTAERWLPLVVVFGREAGEGGARAAIARLGGALPAAGFVVVSPVRDAKATDLQPLFAHVRRTFRIEQGGMHAALDGDWETTNLVAAHRHEFQTVTFLGPIGGGQDVQVRGVAARRVRGPANDLAAHFTSLHGERALTGAAGDVARVLDDFHDAAANGDGARYFAILPDDAVFLGTDGTERWTGAEFRKAFAKYFERGSAWTYVALQRHVTVAPDGAHAWFDEVLDNSSYGECRGSGVLTKRDDRWVLQQYNLTISVPNDLAPGLAARVRALQGGSPAPVTTIVFVRHAEKADASKDSELSEAGRARAEALAAALRDVRFASVLTSEFVRTKSTVAPLCAAGKLTPKEIAAGDGKALARELRAVRGGTVLVCGHSNTIPEVLKSLGVKQDVAIGDDEYDRLFVVTLDPEGARLLSLRY